MSLAKVSRPRVHRTLQRERLFTALDDKRECQLVWVAAPAGSGKTTLVASYVESRKLPCVWYQIDSGDEDVGSFFYYLRQAPVPGRKPRAPPLPLLRADDRTDVSVFARHFFREFFAQLPAAGSLVLDNYHELAHSSALHPVLAQAVQELPEGCNIIVLSRAEPPAELASLRVRGQLDTIEWAQLRLSLDETRALAQVRSTLSDGAIREIHRLADGWAAGISLAMQRARQLRTHDAGAETQILGELFPYFASLVLQSETPETKRFLECTSLLPVVTAVSAQRLSGNADSERILEDLYRRGVFTDRRGTRPPTYQYHDLFRAFLEAELERNHPRETVEQWRRETAAVLEESGQGARAIDQYRQIGDHASVRRIVLREAAALVAYGREGTLQEWIAKLPQATEPADPWIEYWHGASLSRVDPFRARQHLEKSFVAFREAADLNGQRMACAEIILTYHYELSTVVPLDPWLDELLRLLAEEVPFPSKEAELVARSACLYALTFRRPDPIQIRACVQRAFELLGQDMPADTAAAASGILLLHFFWSGDATNFSRLSARLTTLLETTPVSPLGKALTLLQVGIAAQHCGFFEDAQKSLTRSLELAVAHGIQLPSLHVYGHLGLAYAAIERGDLAETELHRRKIEEHWVPGRKTDEAATLRVQYLVACARRNWDAALRFAEQFRGVAQASGIFLLVPEAQLQIALAHAGAKRPAECTRAVSALPGLLAGTAFAHYGYQVDFAEAYAALIAGDRETCRERLRAGLPNSRADEGMFAMRVQPGMLARLLAEALAAGIDTVPRQLFCALERAVIT